MTARQIRVAQQTSAAAGLLLSGCWKTAQQVIRITKLAPTLGAVVSHAAAIAEARELTIGLETLNKITIASVKNYQPYWALKEHLLQNLSCLREAKEAYQRAISLSEDGAVPTEVQAVIESKTDGP